MKQLLTVLGLAGVSLASSFDQMIPQGYALLNANPGIDGNAKDHRIFHSDPMAAQCMIVESRLTAGGVTGLVPGTVIKGFKVRSDVEHQDAVPTVPMVFSSFNLAYSTNTLAGTADMSDLFADNRGADFTLVRSGALTIDANYFPSLDNSEYANPFPDTYIPFDIPWGYSGGNLVIDMWHPGWTSGPQTNVLVDLHGNEGAHKVLVGVPGGPQGVFEGNQHHQAIIMMLDAYNSPEWNCPDGAGPLYCFETDPDCKNNANAGAPISLTGTTLFSDAVNLCMAQNPMARCAKCGDTGTCFALLTGESKAVGDPHFVGFDGSRFDFYGEDGRVFNIISDVNFQMNSLFKEMTVQGSDGTWMVEIGILYQNNSLIYSPTRGILVNENFVMRTGETKAFNDMVVRADNPKRILIETPEYTVKIDVVGTENVYLNLETSMTRFPVDPHGILGQTARVLLNKQSSDRVAASKNRVLDGEESDYLVHDGLLGTDFTFNRFQNIDLPLNTKRGSVNLEARAALPNF